jgi:hypothetical protein
MMLHQMHFIYSWRNSTVILGFFVALTTLFSSLLWASGDLPVLAQQAYLKASNTGGGDEFGWSVAMSGDTLVIGARGEASNATGVNGDQSDNSTGYAGAAYVFTSTGDSWSQQAYLKASNSDNSDRFGISVAISGDTLVVGAPFEDSIAAGIDGDQGDNSALDAGAAYVFTRDGTIWSQQAYLKASNSAGSDRFGTSVAISGDTLVVGANFEDSIAAGIDGDQGDNSASAAGAAYVFTRSGTTWNQQTYLKASNSDAGDEFGSFVAMSGDTLVVGAIGEASNSTGVNGDQSDNSADFAGAVYVFTRSDMSWSQQAYLKASNPGDGDRFGTSVDIFDDILVVGANFEDSIATGVDGDQGDDSASAAGAAYVFARNGTIWSQQAYLKASNTGGGDEFGRSVVIFRNTLMVNAFREDSNATGIDGDQNDNSASGAGAVYVFDRHDAAWSQLAYLKATNSDGGDGFGFSMAISGDTLVVGAIGEASNAMGINGDESNNSAFHAGAVYVTRRFTMNPGLNDAWYNPETDGQGFFITVFPDLGAVSLAWFTYDTELPAEDVTANLGDPGHRWLTAVGPIEGNQAVMEIEMTSGGIFDAASIIERTDPRCSDGTFILTFDSCNSGSVEYDIPSINQQGLITITRVANDNIVICEALSEELQNPQQICLQHVLCVLSFSRLKMSFPG